MPRRDHGRKPSLPTQGGISIHDPLKKQKGEGGGDRNLESEHTFSVQAVGSLDLGEKTKIQGERGISPIFEGGGRG